MKTLMITDPDGNHIAFAEAIDPSMASDGVSCLSGLS